MKICWSQHRNPPSSYLTDFLKTKAIWPFSFGTVNPFYDILIGMDWLDKHNVVLDCHNETFTCLNEEGKQSLVKGIPRPISIREISAL